MPCEYSAPLPLRRRTCEFPIDGVEVGSSCDAGDGPLVMCSRRRKAGPGGEAMADPSLSLVCWSFWIEAEDFPSAFTPAVVYKVSPALGGSGGGGSGGAPAAHAGLIVGLVPQGPSCNFFVCWGACTTGCVLI